MHVGLDQSGAVRSVTVDQHLTVSGVGDFDMKVLGPATDVASPEGASPRPGLRNGTVLWQGFSPGTKVLASTVTLQPQFEQARLPLSVRRTGTEVTIANLTAVPVGFSTGDADPAALHAAIAAVRARLAVGQRPVPGADGVPAALSSRGPVTTQRQFVAAPMRVRGAIGGTAVDALVLDKLVVSDPGPVHLTVTPAVPDAAALGDNAGVADLQLVMAQVARLSQYDAYEGVTVPGPSTTRYEYGPAAAPPAPKPVRKDDKAHPLTMALAALAALGLALVSWAAWARS